MEVNKDEAERCKVIGTNALKQKQYERAAKFFKKSLSLYPLPGVDVFLSTAERLASNENQDNENDANQSSNFTRSTSTASSSTATTTPTSPGGRAYTEAQVQIVETILQAKATGGRTAHYKVLQLSSTNPTEAEIKKAYRKLAIKVHPDKNSAPKADEAFKAVGLAYATLSDPQKKVIYDQSGEEDPDNRGGGGGMRRHGGMHFRPGDEVSPEDIFNMFFGGGMPGGMGGSMHRGPGGMHFYSNFGGGGMNGFARAHQQQQQRRRAPAGQAQRPQNDDAPPGLASMMQLLPFLLILALSFFNMNDGTGMGSAGGTASPGLDRYFSLTRKEPFVNPMHTKLTKVQEIPYYVDHKVMRAINRDRSQLVKLERMVESSYENYLVDQCNVQRRDKKRMLAQADAKPTPEERKSAKASAENIALTRCVELNELFPLRHAGRR